MKPTQFNAVKSILKATYGIDDYQIKEQKNERIIVTPKNSSAFHGSGIISAIESLHISNYIAYNKELDKIELHIF